MRGICGTAVGMPIRRHHIGASRATLIGLTPVAEATCARLGESYQRLARLLFERVDAQDLRRFLAVLRHAGVHLDDAVRQAIQGLEGRA